MKISINFKYLLATLLLVAPAFARAQFTFNAKINYERKVSIYKLYEDNEWFTRSKERYPKFVVNNFEMTFTPTNSYYKPGKEIETQKMGWLTPPGAENEVFMDFKTNLVTARKPIFEQNFIIQDSMRNLKWKISSEIRTIANYKCRKAVSKICDSVYIVAFYAEDIPVSGGPEQFGGLPGMILQLAVPRLHTVWTATQVDLIAITNPDIPPFSGKSKKVNRKEMESTLQKSMKDWGKDGAKNIWWSSL